MLTTKLDTIPFIDESAHHSICNIFCRLDATIYIFNDTPLYIAQFRKLTYRMCGKRRYYVVLHNPDSKVHGANMESIWGRQDPGGPHELDYLGFEDLCV